MSASESLNTLLLEVIVSSKNQRIFIGEFNDLTWQIIFDGCCASMNVGSKCPIASNTSRLASSWRLYLHCGIEETGSPGIICIVCHQVIHHQSECETSSMGKHLLAKAHITKLNELTESEVSELTSSTVDEAALAILNRQESWGITVVSSQRKFLFHIPPNPFWSKWQRTCSKLAARDFETSEFHQDTWNPDLMLGCVSANIPWNAISNLELRRSYKVLCSELVQLLPMTLGNICRREHALTLDAIRKYLLSWNNVTLA